MAIGFSTCLGEPKTLLLEGTNKSLVCTRTQQKGAVTPQGTEPDLPASDGGAPAEVRVSRPHLWDGGMGSSSRRRCPVAEALCRLPLKPYYRAWRLEGWVTSGQKSNREGL